VGEGATAACCGNDSTASGRTGLKRSAGFSGPEGGDESGGLVCCEPAVRGLRVAVAKPARCDPFFEAARKKQSRTRGIAQRLSAIFGYAWNLTLEPFEIRVSSPGGEPGLVLKQLSESERFRFAIAFQLALAMATGIRFVVIDRADVLDRARRKMLTALLLSSEIDQGSERRPIGAGSAAGHTAALRPRGTRGIHQARQRPFPPRPIG
jgi:hypothetical protein